MKHELQERIEVELKDLYLDPNNYRFIDLSNYVEVPKAQIVDERIQKRTKNFLLGAKNQHVSDLIKSFKANGYLEVDQIQVEKIGESQFRVLEGNRRIATLIHLKELYDDGHDIGLLDPDLFSKVPVTLVNQQREGEHEMVMALKHISGNKKWPTLNQAQLLKDLIDKFGWTERQVTESVGITLHKLRRDLRTIALIELYKQSDYGDQFETNMYTIFREVVSSTDLKHWLEWDDINKKPLSLKNTERLFSWLSATEVEEPDGEGNDIKYTKKKIITQGDQIRTLASIISDEAAVDYMEQERSIVEAYGISTVVANERYKSTLRIIEQQVETAKLLSKNADQEDKLKILQIKKDIESILVSISGLEKIEVGGNATKLLYNFRNTQLKEIQLEHYKRFEDGFIFGPFNRVNIFAGNNNVGKTSILEAIFLLCQLNNFEGLYRTYKQRGKFSDGVPTDWLLQVIPTEFLVKGVFDDSEVQLSVQKAEESDATIDKSSYKTSIYLNAKHREDTYETKIRISSGKGKYESYYEKLAQLCNVVMSNPFVMQDRSVLEHYYNIAIENGKKNEIVDFLRREIDSNILAIDKGGSGDNFRFLVEYKGSERPIDLTEFGDGIQRVFHISLMVVAAENGVICIDEIENAIHYKLLVSFTDFIQKLAHEHNVQVFVSTHSAECVKAFFENNYENEEITGFRLINKDGKISSQKAIGNQLQIQLEEFSLDLRG